VVKSGYVTASKNLFIDTATVSTLNIKIISTSANVERKNFVALNNYLPYISQLPSGDIIVQNLTGKGKLRMVDLKGNVVYKTEYLNNGSLLIPVSIVSAKRQLYIVQIVGEEKTTSTTLRLVKIRN
ncbi:MAG: hypothetical protein N2053_13080, partial [Chitinispirillaceae bacterium]|nr:hypothetical protein [Chitinispirillaceae bacterium]